MQVPGCNLKNDRMISVRFQGKPFSITVQFSSVQSLSRVRLFVTLWIMAFQASLSVTNSQSLLKLMSIESVMPSNHLIVCHPLCPPAFNPSQHQGPFQWGGCLHQVAKVWCFSFYLINTLTLKLTIQHDAKDKLPRYIWSYIGHLDSHIGNADLRCPEKFQDIKLYI